MQSHLREFCFVETVTWREERICFLKGKYDWKRDGVVSSCTQYTVPCPGACPVGELCVIPTRLTALCDLNTYTGHVLALKSPHLILKSHLIHTWLFLSALNRWRNQFREVMGLAWDPCLITGSLCHHAVSLSRLPMLRTHFSCTRGTVLNSGHSSKEGSVITQVTKGRSPSY